MNTMTLEELKLKEDFGRKVYYRKGYAIVAKYYSSKFWWPWDWYKVKIDIEG